MSPHAKTLPPCTGTTQPVGLLERLGGLLGDFGREIRRRLELRERRRAFLNLTHLDDRTLDDIGLRRGEVESAADLPLEINASLAVRQMAADRRAAERRIRRR